MENLSLPLKPEMVYISDAERYPTDEGSPRCLGGEVSLPLRVVTKSQVLSYQSFMSCSLLWPTCLLNLAKERKTHCRRLTHLKYLKPCNGVSHGG